MKNKIIIIGSGGHAKSVIDVIENSNNWKIIGLIGLKNDLNKKILGYKVIGTDDDLEIIRKDCSNCCIGIGQIKSSEKRYNIACKLKKLGFKFPKIISPSARVSRHSEINSGTFIGHGVIINAASKIGKNCIINSNALLEHDTEIGDFTHISTGALINGGVYIGKKSFIGSGTIIREGIKIPEETIVGAGRTILSFPPKDI